MEQQERMFDGQVGARWRRYSPSSVPSLPRRGCPRSGRVVSNDAKPPIFKAERRAVRW